MRKSKFLLPKDLTEPSKVSVTCKQVNECSTEAFGQVRDTWTVLFPSLASPNTVRPRLGRKAAQAHLLPIPAAFSSLF